MSPVHIKRSGAVSRARPSELPDFKRPPIDELVLSIQFASVAKFKSAHVGLLWRSFRSKYPEVTEQPPIQAAFETFGTPSSAPHAIRFQAFPSPPMPRFWFEKAGRPDLLQLQQDRILHNWRKREEDPIYPRFEAIAIALKTRFRSS